MNEVTANSSGTFSKLRLLLIHAAEVFSTDSGLSYDDSPNPGEGRTRPTDPHAAGRACLMGEWQPIYRLGFERESFRVVGGMRAAFDNRTRNRIYHGGRSLERSK